MDAAGFALSRGHFSRAYPSRNETALETFYRIQLSPQFAVTPDLQYFLHPGASSRGLVAFGARFALSLKSSSE
jgi:carbohydrate-selective porin OprB